MPTPQGARGQGCSTGVTTVETLAKRRRRPCDVLIVAGDPRFRRSVAQTLQHEGYEVVGASNGVDALEALEAVDPWLILLDSGLPIMHRPELARELRLRGDRAKIVVLTDGPEARPWPDVIQADGAIEKSVDSGALLAAVAELRALP
jgi:two-component system response regulator MprA